VVFAAQHDRSLGRGVWVRLFGGSLENRASVALPAGTDPFTGEEKTESMKISQIFDPDGNPVGKLHSGEIGIVYGLGNVPIGHVLGNMGLVPRRVEPGRLRTPLITVQVIPEKPEQMQALHQACTVLSGEDPLLQAQYIRSLNELHLQVMGTIQLEILEEILKTRFDINVTFTPPAIIYRETVAQSCEGFVAYLAPKPCWAILRFRIDPAPRGSGVTFTSQVPVRTVKAHYQNQVAQAIPLALNQGRLGWQVTDVNITLIDGGDHQFHTHPLDFIVATPMAIQDGLRNGGSTLLEPILDVRFLLPPESVGRVISDVSTMRGEVLDSFSDGERMILNARIPVQSSLDYSITLASFTGGRGAMSVRLHGYRECPLELGATAKRRNVDPLDTSKYILAARSALEGGIFDI
jgi:ribosomal protection tetracycline resistance protein